VRIPARIAQLLVLLSFAFEGVAMAVEEPVYQASVQQGAFEVREYPPAIVAEVAVPGAQDAAANAGFRLLAHYIFGGNAPRQRIAIPSPVEQSRSGGQSLAMTAPVTQFQDGTVWMVRFFMPRGYTLETLPVPDDPRVRLRALPQAEMAVVRFSGLAYAGDVARRTTELEEFMAARHLRPAGPPVLARYNPPWTLWFLRRNEVMIPVAATHTPP
jgi:hypothetical protein